MLELKKFLKLGVAGLSLYMISASAFLGAHVDSEVAPYVGWRNDSISRKFSESGTSTTSDRLKVRNANLWQIGVAGRFGAPDCFCGCGTEWMSNIYLRGCASYGWYTDGRFRDRTAGDSTISDSTSHRKVRNGHAEDYSIGIGYLYPVTCDFSIGPVGGYAYDRQHLRSKRHHSGGSSSSFFSSSDFSTISTDYSTPSSVVGTSAIASGVPRSLVGSSDSSDPLDTSRRSLNSRWDGGWIGFDATYKLCDWDVCFGYEYHFASFRGKNHSNSSSSTSIIPPTVVARAAADAVPVVLPAVVGDSDSTSTDVDPSVSSSGHHRKHKHGFGHVVYVDARWNLCDCWDFIGGFKYQYYNTRHHNASWHAFGIQAGLGWRF